MENTSVWKIDTFFFEEGKCVGSGSNKWNEKWKWNRKKKKIMEYRFEIWQCHYITLTCAAWICWLCRGDIRIDSCRWHLELGHLWSPCTGRGLAYPHCGGTGSSCGPPCRRTAPPWCKFHHGLLQSMNFFEGEEIIIMNYFSWKYLVLNLICKWKKNL